MRKLIPFIVFLGIVLLIFAFRASTNETGYNSVKIGKQIWMQKNLDVNVFRNGDLIPEAKTTEEWNKAGSNKKPAWCYYNNDPVLGKKYGKLYNWWAVNDSRSLAPLGWHIPTEEEFWTFKHSLEGDDKNGYLHAGGKMKSATDDWIIDNGKSAKGTDSSGFTALPAGFVGGPCNGLGKEATWWTATPKGIRGAFYFWISAWGGSIIMFGTQGETGGCSVRCVKDTVK